MTIDNTIHARLERLNAIGIALSSEENLDRLLETIVDEARSFTQADAGTLYLRQEQSLNFAIVQNATQGVRMGGVTGEPISWPPIPLEVDGHPNLANVCAYVAVKGETVNIPDVYTAEGFDFAGTRRFDANTGYRSQSMLTAPLRDNEGEIIGVLQLINAQGEEGTVPFPVGVESLVASLASQAAVALTKAKLIRDTEALFEAFVQVMAVAIDERSPSTAGHIERVSHITLALAQALNEEKDGAYADVSMSADEMNELRIAAWMHDVGKVTTPVHIVEKRTKLESVYDRIESVKLRFELLKQQVEKEFLQQQSALLAKGAQEHQLRKLQRAYQDEQDSISDDQRFVVECNAPVEFMPEDKVERLRQIAKRTYTVDGERRPVLSPDELANLTVQRGNLTGEELALMREHADVTIRLLQQIPFTRKLSRVPLIAGSHHEKLNGKGYPQGLAASDIPLQTRMLAIADVYDALTANDRSYKKPRTEEEALRILGFMVKDGEIDAELYRLFSARVVPRLTKPDKSLAV